MIQPARNIKAVLLAAGLGTRLRPLTDDCPKCLIEIDGRPLLDYWVVAVGRAGIGEALINTHHGADMVREYIAQNNAKRKVRLVESHEPELLGSAGTLHANRNWANDSTACVLIYADNLSDVDLSRLCDYHQSHDDPLTVVLFHAPVPESCGIVTLDGENRIIAFEEKPQRPVGDLANAGVYVCDSHLYEKIADMDVHDFGYDVLPKLIGQMRGWVWDGFHLDVGTHQALDEARQKAPTVFGLQP